VPRPKRKPQECTCKICGTIFFATKTQNQKIRTTCGPECTREARRRGGSQKAEEIEIDPLDYARRLFIVQNNSMVDSGHLRCERLVMYW
jgi:hypothetical protein